MRRIHFWASVGFVCLVCAAGLYAQQDQPGANPSSATASSAVAAVPRLIKFSGVLRDLAGKPLTGPVDINFGIYKEPTDATPLWQEVQTLQADEQGRYAVLLGVTQAGGLPMELFTSGEARWLGVEARGAEPPPRVLLVSVPYAFKAGDAETLGGKPASAFVQAEDQTAAGGSAEGTTATSTSTQSAGGEVKAAISKGGKPTPKLTSGTAGYIGKFTNTTDLGNSVMFESSGKIGLGTTTPAVALDVVGNNAGLRLTGTGTHQITVTGVSSGRLGQDANGFFFASDTKGSTVRFLTNNGTLHEWMRITSSGSVGIGTTTPTATLEVNGTGKFTGPTGVVGQGTNYGVSGSGSVAGVSGDSGSASLGKGVYGSSSGANGYGVYGYNASNIGVQGYGINGVAGDSGAIASGIGVVGTSTNASGVGVYGTNASNVGVWGYGQQGVFGTGKDLSGSYGVYGYTNVTNGYGVYGYNPIATGVYGSGGTGGYDYSVGVRGHGFFGVVGVGVGGSGSAGVYGDCHITACSYALFGYGNFGATGVKNAIVPLLDDRLVSLYSVESPEVWFEDFGSAQLQDGAARINIEAEFLQTVNTDTQYHVYLTPDGDCLGLYVANKTPSEFEVRELGRGKSNVAFDYRIVARRRGYEDVRMQKVGADSETVQAIRQQAKVRTTPELHVPKSLPVALPEPPKDVAARGPRVWGAQTPP